MSQLSVVHNSQQMMFLTSQTRTSVIQAIAHTVCRPICKCTTNHKCLSGQQQNLHYKHWVRSHATTLWLLYESHSHRYRPNAHVMDPLKVHKDGWHKEEEFSGLHHLVSVEFKGRKQLWAFVLFSVGPLKSFHFQTNKKHSLCKSRKIFS